MITIPDTDLIQALGWLPCRFDHRDQCQVHGRDRDGAWCSQMQDWLFGATYGAALARDGIRETLRRQPGVMDGPAAAAIARTWEPDTTGDPDA